MPTHASSVNFKNLIHDLAEMYPFDIAEVVVIELVANALDAAATRIAIDYFADKNALVIEDDGKGMSQKQFEEYHDFAAGLKKRGEGIGFAGLGAKISFNIADRVLTESRSPSLCCGSNWYLKSKKKLVWDDINVTHLRNQGTRVEVHFRRNETPNYSTASDLIKILKRHYLPLLDYNYLNMYNALHIYSKNLRFIVNGELVEPSNVITAYELENVMEFFPKRAKKKYGMGIFGVSKHEYPVAANVCGVLLCTYGKVIKSEFFNQFPGGLGTRIFGLVEIPDLIGFLTTSKTDFIHWGKHREFERYYGPVRDAFKNWLREIGLSTTEIESDKDALKLEKELKKIIEEVPELSEFFGFRSQKNVLSETQDGSTSATKAEGIEGTIPVGEGNKGGIPGFHDAGDASGTAMLKDSVGSTKAEPISRTARRGPKITFDERLDRSELAWVDGNTIVINKAHPSYVKAHSNNLAIRLHNLFAIANAIQRFLNLESDTEDQTFIDRMMAAWGRT